MPKHNQDELADVYGKIVFSFFQGMLRFWRAEAAHARLMSALACFNGHKKSSPPIDGNPYKHALEDLARIPYSSYSASVYVTNVSHLTYATTLLDTFLSDTTMFLYLVYPEAMGKKLQVPIQVLIDAHSRHEALTTATAKRVREIAFSSFVDRIQLLRDTFGLDPKMDSEATHALEHYPSIRNTAVHDQGIFELRLNESGHVVSRQKTCAQHPTKINGTDVQAAADAYKRIGEAIARAVAEKLFKNNQKMKRLLKITDVGIGGEPSKDVEAT